MGGFVSGVTGKGADGAVAFSVTNTGAAQDLLDKTANSKEKDATYNGVDYKVSSADGSAYGIIGDFAVVGTEQGFKDAVDAYSGDSLADDSTATDALDTVPSDTLFSAYVDARPRSTRRSRAAQSRRRSSTRAAPPTRSTSSVTRR